MNRLFLYTVAAAVLAAALYSAALVVDPNLVAALVASAPASGAALLAGALPAITYERKDSRGDEDESEAVEQIRLLLIDQGNAQGVQAQAGRTIGGRRKGRQ